MNIIFNFLSGLLNSIFNFTGDWGLAIVLLTVSVRVILSPLSFKQKKAMQQQQKFTIKMQEIKEKYKDNKDKLDEEVKKYSAESAKGMLGCLVTLLQAPILMTMWSVIKKMPVNVETVLVPWVSSISVPDSHYIIPLIYMLASLTPSLLSYVAFLKIEGQATASKGNITMIALVSLFFAKAAPIALGIYLITTSMFSFLEELAFRVYIKNVKTV